MMMSKNFLLIAVVIAGLAGVGGYYYSYASIAASGENKIAERAGSETASIALPGKTRDAWQIEDFGLLDLDGQQRDLAEWQGKVILMNFWATWCAPCQYEIPELVKLQRSYADKGLQILGYGLDEHDKLANVARSLEINYPVLVVPDGRRDQLLTQWGSTGQVIPHSVIIAKNGQIEYIHRGLIGQDEIELYLLPLLDQ